jgi:hypothetical protein
VEERRVEVIKFHQSSPSPWEGETVKRLLALFVVFLGVLNPSRGWAQTANSSATSNPPAGAAPSAAALAAFQTEQQALGESLRQLMAQGATPAQIEAWHQQNASRIAAQQQRAQAMSAAQPRQPMPYVTHVEIPEGASETMEDFLTARANLQNARAQLHNQQLQSTGHVDETQVETAFQKQNAAALQAQAQRAQTLAQESDSQPLPVPPPLTIPPGSSPAMQQFLTLRDQLMRGEVQMHNQNLSLSFADRAKALQQWREQNADRFKQLQSFAQNMSAAAAN